MTAVDPQGVRTKRVRRVQAQASRRTGRTIGAGLALALAALAAGCSSPTGESEGATLNKPKTPLAREAPACPRVALLADAAHLSAYREGSLDPTDLMVSADLTGIRGECSFPPTLTKVTVDMTVLLQASKGPAATGNTAQLTYFVAVVDADKQVRARREFTLPVTFPPGQTRAPLADALTEEIPLPQGVAAASFQVLVGFKLTPEQLQRNRARANP